MAALNRLKDLKDKSKIVILMTDGQNNSGKIPPLTAAEAAQALGVKVYTIGIGPQGTAPYPVGRDHIGQMHYQYDGGGRGRRNADEDRAEDQRQILPGGHRRHPAPDLRGH